MMTAVLRELNSACIVVSRDLKVLHANKAARRLLGRRSEHPGQIEFSDLPADLGRDIYQVLNSGAALDTKRYQPANAPDALFNISLMPLRHGNSAMPISALLIAEDIAEREQLSRLKEKSAGENAELQLLRNMSFRVSNEIGGLVTPIQIHHQMLNDKWKDPEFIKTFDEALNHGIKSIRRLSNQMRFLTPESLGGSGTFAIGKVIEEAFQEAKSQEPRTSEGKSGPQLKLTMSGPPPVVRGNRSALKHAFAEILLNALQASPKKPEIEVAVQIAGSGQKRFVVIEVHDAGKGFSPEEARQATTPFYGEKVGCVGLGLTVSQKIIASHQGKLEIVPSESGVVRVTLPLEDKAG
jgi:two-component system sensor histidine kinase AtoS